MVQANHDWQLASKDKNRIMGDGAGPIYHSLWLQTVNTSSTSSFHTSLCFLFKKSPLREVGESLQKGIGAVTPISNVADSSNPVVGS